MIRVLGLALYGSLAASHRVRLRQYREGLYERGIDLKVQSLFCNEYLQSRFERGSRPIFPVFKAGLQRLKLLLSKRRFDIAVVHCELFPFMPAWLERGILRIPFIYDFDDAFYLRYRTGYLHWLNPILGNKFESVMRGSAAITAGNEYLAKYAGVLNPIVTVLPSVVDTQRFAPSLRPDNPVFTVGWVGSPSTAKYLDILVAPLKSLGRERRIKLVVVGSRAPRIEGIETLELPWSESAEAELINTFDVGVMPLYDDEWARGKCAFKLVQFMACGVPVVASSVGANINLVTKDCGFLVSNAEQWVDAIGKLYDLPLMRQQMGAASRRRVEDDYSLERNLPIFSGVIHAVVSKHAETFRRNR